MRHILSAILLGCCTLAAIGQEAPFEAGLTVQAGQPMHGVSPLLFGHNVEWVWGGQGLFNKDGSGPVEGLVPLLSELKPGLIRYPGGSLSNTFRWSASVGPLAGRKPVANFFTLKGNYRMQKLTYQSEVPLLGFDDFMSFVKATQSAGAMVTVNCTMWPQNPELSGTAQEAAAWVAYANARVGDAAVAIGVDERGEDWKDSQYWAALRAANGHAEPYGVLYWEIGNEVYDAGQGAGMSAAAYARRAIEFARLMKSVDPAIRIGTVIVWENPAWNRAVIQGGRPEPGRPDAIDFLIPHKYGPGIAGDTLALWSTGGADVRFDVAAAGPHRLVLEAAGQHARNIFPQMAITLDGNNLGEYTVDANKAQRKRQRLEFDRDLTAGTHVLTISFLNDEYAPPDDRNLFIEGVWLQGEGQESRRLTLLPAEEILKQMSAQAEMTEFYLKPIRQLMTEAGVALPFQMTEYNAMYGTTPELLRGSRDLKSALYSARHLQCFLADPRIEGANFWCVRSAWFRVVQWGPEGLRYTPAGLMLRSMMPLRGGNVVDAQWQQQPLAEVTSGAKTAPWVTAVAVRSEKQLALNFVTWHPTRAARLAIRINGAEPAQTARRLTLTGPGPEAFNEERGAAPVSLKEDEVPVGGEFALELPPLAVTTLIIPLR